MNRRQFIATAAATALSPSYGACRSSVHWQQHAYRRPRLSRVAILAAKQYDGPLKEILLRGLKLFHLDVRDKTIVLKPNLVEFDPLGVINTHPAVIAAALESFRALGAREVIVAEGPGHRRDNEYLLTASGLYDVLKEYDAHYVDLNYDDVRRVDLRSSFTRLKRLYLPETLFRADLLVSLPKLKTHHWAAVTLSLKNMFGIIPGAVYGWPKNILHWEGIDGSILDINAALQVPQFTVIDGIVGMEGNGPLHGEPRNSGFLVLGDDAVAVDATAARLMKIEPRRIAYLAQAGEFLGNIGRERIEQIGEKLESHEQDFRVIDSFARLKNLPS
jgi:uncharacterized protein (DUF362 family)